MLLLIDAGNSLLKWAVPNAQPAAVVGAGRWAHHGTVARAEVGQLRETWQGLAGEKISRVLVSNVAGQVLHEQLDEVLKAVFGAAVHVEWFASVAQRAGVRNGYRTPGQLGCDRFATAIGAHALYPGEELVVATCGTATTIDIVTADGEFQGGMILPGLGAMATSLALTTAQLPQIHAMPDDAAPFADNTVDAIAAGCLAAQAGAIEHAVRRRRESLGETPLRCLVAGGTGALLLPRLALGETPVEKLDNLVLIGLHTAASAQR